MTSEKNLGAVAESWATFSPEPRKGSAVPVRSSIEAMLHNQQANGAIIASPDFAQYRYCWLRDASFVAYALDCVGEHSAAARYHDWVGRALDGIGGKIDAVVEKHSSGKAIDPSDMPPARFELDGSTAVDDWPNFQIDGYGTWLWTLGQHLDQAEQSMLPAGLRLPVERAGRYLAEFALAPCFDVWEENGTAVHTSSLACIFGGLTAAARLLDDPLLLEQADVVRAFLRAEAERTGYFAKSTESREIDASTLWLSTPFGVVAGDDPRFERTVTKIEEQLTLDGGIRRYPSDSYFGGGAWPVLTASLGWHYASTGDLAAAYRCRDRVTASFDGLRLAEQLGGERRDPRSYREWVERWGPPAADLVWSHAMYVLLCSQLGPQGDGHLIGED